MVEAVMKENEIIEREGVITGTFRRPVNEAINVKTSIHHDETAQKLGLRGGTVAGSIHMEQFPPLFTQAFGQQWFETGGISMYFRYITTHQEPVKCFVRRPEAGDNSQVEIWMEHENGNLVGDGTASIGNPKEPSVLRKRVNNLHPPGEVRIYKDIEPGMEIPPVDVRISLEEARRRMEIITEPLDWYVNDSPWGGPILTPALMIRAFMTGINQFRSGGGEAVVGLYGALEFRYINGPVFIDHDYVLTGKIIAVGETPKTEYIWHEGQLKEPDTGRVIAEALNMSRVMKASSSLYPELQQDS